MNHFILGFCEASHDRTSFSFIRMGYSLLDTRYWLFLIVAGARNG